jgi:hypothetical protein
LTFHIHWYRRAWRSFAYDYSECRCGRRRAFYRLERGYSPVDWEWVRGAKRPPHGWHVGFGRRLR